MAAQPAAHAPFTAVVAAVDRAHASVTLVGELDFQNAHTLTRVTSELLELDVRHVVLDAAQLSFIDVAGFRAVLRASDTLDAASGSLRIRNPSRMLRRLVDLSGVGDRVAFEHADGGRDPAHEGSPWPPAG